MTRGDEHIAHVVVVFRSHPDLALPAAFLRLILAQGHALDVVLMRANDHAIFFGDEIFVFDFDFGIDDFGQSRIAIELLYLFEFANDNFVDSCFRFQNALVILNRLQQSG